MSHAAPSANPFRQPRAVWAVAAACVVSFMGIGLVDPILPALAHSLHASPSDVSLLFTSYLVVTAVAMLLVGAVSSRIGPKRTLVVGLSLIVVFSALAGSSGSISGIVGFRAGWGLGNALFIATSLAVIVASASGGFGGAIILYETALGVGIAVGPLLGGELGSISWRGPFYGVAVLMGIALVATVFFVPSLPKPAQPVSITAPLRALRHRGLLTMGVMALLYNWGFFTMLGYSPYPMELDAHHLGLVFTGWGALVALFSVVVAPRLQRRFGTPASLYANLVALAAVMVAIAAGVDTPKVVIVAVIVSGAFIGINNTLTTQAVMLVSPVDRPIASSAYGFVRFIGGGLAPYAAGKLADATSLSVPFYLGAGTFLFAGVVLATGHGLVRAAERQSEPQPLVETVQGPATQGRPIVVALGASTDAEDVLEAAAGIAQDLDAPLDVVHVRYTVVLEELAIEPEEAEVAQRTVARHLQQVQSMGVPAAAHVLHAVGDRADIGRALARHAAAVDARLIAIGRSSHGALVQFAEGSLTTTLMREAPCDVVLVTVGETPRQLTDEALEDLRRP